ncbi:plasmid pRiA4b ORF-3 family protein [Pseudomonadota bacterium]
MRIELQHIQPLIWRCVVVPDTITLVQLHAVIQDTMGWWHAHLHEFQIGHQRYGQLDPDWDTDPELINEARKRLLTVLGSKKIFRYAYDFGDDWQHRITLEQQLPLFKPQRYALCVSGENACPPEDVGGVPGYAEFLDAIADPTHEEHESMLEWCGGSFVPTHFDIEAANDNLKKIKL